MPSACLKMLDRLYEPVRCLASVMLQTLKHAPASETPTAALARLQNPMKQSFDGMTRGLKEVHKALADYSKALDKVFITVRRSALINRADWVRDSKTRPYPHRTNHPYSRKMGLSTGPLGCIFFEKGNSPLPRRS